jgi:hypothetical protein
LIRALEIETGAAHWQLFDSDELFYTLPQSMMLSSNMRESQIITDSSSKSYVEHCRERRSASQEDSGVVG